MLLDLKWKNKNAYPVKQEYLRLRVQQDFPAQNAKNMKLYDASIAERLLQNTPVLDAALRAPTKNGSGNCNPKNNARRPRSQP